MKCGDTILEKQMDIQRLLDLICFEESIDNKLAAYDEMAELIRECKEETMGNITVSIPGMEIK